MIREATPSDYPLMETVFRNSARALCIDSYSSDVIEEWTGEYRPERFAESLQQGNQQYVLLIAGRLVCFGSINIDKTLLVSLFADPSAAGQGIGAQMLQFLIAKVAKAGVQKLKIDASLNAVRFYAKYGFKETGLSHYQTQSGNSMKSVQMVCEINPE
jgi:GNAT superfamily N-acetyltransferase